MSFENAFIQPFSENPFSAPGGAAAAPGVYADPTFTNVELLVDYDAGAVQDLSDVAKAMGQNGTAANAGLEILGRDTRTFNSSADRVFTNTGGANYDISDNDFMIEGTISFSAVADCHLLNLWDSGTGQNDRAYAFAYNLTSTRFELHYSTDGQVGTAAQVNSNAVTLSNSVRYYYGCARTGGKIHFWYGNLDTDAFFSLGSTVNSAHFYNTATEIVRIGNRSDGAGFSEACIGHMGQQRLTIGQGIVQGANPTSSFATS